MESAMAGGLALGTLMITTLPVASIGSSRHAAAAVPNTACRGNDTNTRMQGRLLQNGDPQSSKTFDSFQSLITL